MSNFISLLLMGFKLMAGAVASCALIGVAVGAINIPAIGDSNP